jgi:hypothetical protein
MTRRRPPGGIVGAAVDNGGRPDGQWYRDRKVRADRE